MENEINNIPEDDESPSPVKQNLKDKLEAVQGTNV